MTENDAQAWVAEHFGESSVEKLDHYAALLTAESDQQNLVSSSTLPSLWTRHLLDSAQLVPMAPSHGLWLDIGSGAGLPGIVVAILRQGPVKLVEPRRLRVEFLTHCKNLLGLNNVEIIQSRIERVTLAGGVAVVSARAVATLEQLFASAYHLADKDTVWVLPKGRNAQSEVALARKSWQGVFHVKPSVVDPSSGIVVATALSRIKR